MSDWILAGERLPEKMASRMLAPKDVFMSVDVLCLLDNGDYEVGYYIYPHHFSKGNVWICNDKEIEVSHWTSLPELPHAAKSETKTMTETYGLTPEEVELPARKPDPHGMGFTDEAIAALTVTDDAAAKALAFGLATPETRALLAAKEGE